MLGNSDDRTRCSLLAAVTRTAWEKHRSYLGERFPDFAPRDITTPEGLSRIYLDLMWLALAWAKAGEYQIELCFSHDLRLHPGKCKITCFGGRGTLTVRCRDDSLEAIREYLFSMAASDGFMTDARNGKISWLLEDDYAELKDGSYIPKKPVSQPTSGLARVDSSKNARGGLIL